MKDLKKEIKREKENIKMWKMNLKKKKDVGLEERKRHLDVKERNKENVGEKEGKEEINVWKK